MNTPHLPGKFVWFQLLTQDIDKAIRSGIGRFAIAVDATGAAVAFLMPTSA